MSKLFQLKLTNIEYLPLFLLICLSGNPLLVAMPYSKSLLTIYTVFFSLFVYNKMEWKLPKKIVLHLFGIIIFIFILVLFQNGIFGYVSYPGVLSIILKIILGLFTILYYKLKKLDILDLYIKILAFLSIMSIPFFILNQFGFYGIEIGEEMKSFILYTSKPREDEILRNPGMFWEPGAYAGYLILVLLFIAIKNKRFIIGPYRNEVLLITIGLITTLSTTGFILYSIIILIYSWQNYKWGKIIVVPLFLLIAISAYTTLPFMREKIEHQYNNATEMSESDVSNTRFGSLIMDMEYIKSQPIFGNGLNIITRYRFHPEVTVDEDIGNGNGMSNFLACWGIPLFLFWLFGAYNFARSISKSTTTAFVFTFLIILSLQGETISELSDVPNVFFATLCLHQ